MLRRRVVPGGRAADPERVQQDFLQQSPRRSGRRNESGTGPSQIELRSGADPSGRDGGGDDGETVTTVTTVPLTPAAAAVTTDGHGGGDGRDGGSGGSDDGGGGSSDSNGDGGH